MPHDRAQPLRHALTRVAVAGAAGSLLLSGAVVAGAGPAGAAPAAPAAVAAPAAKAPAKAVAPSKAAKKATKRKMLDRKALLRTAASLKGRPYRWGATGPRAFDCSGYTVYVMKSQRRKIPRTSAAQYRHAWKIRRTSARPGDLVFYRSTSGRVYHVGIYAGKGRIWHSPHSGSRVKLSKITNKRWAVGRIR